jgi:hypothetical protein
MGAPESGGEKGAGHLFRRRREAGRERVGDATDTVPEATRLVDKMYQGNQQYEQIVFDVGS